MWSQYKLKYARGDLHDLVSLFCHEGSFHPVLDHLNGLDEWDGIEPLDEWLHAYLGAEKTELNAFIGKATLVAAVRRVRHPGCKFDYLTILEGPQGIMKSTAIQALCPEVSWFLDGFKLSTATKEVMELTSGKWIVEISELVGRKMDHNAVKTLLSKQHDKSRMAYGHYSEERARQFIFIGTTNDEEYLIDPTGNRRYWPVMCGATINIEALKRDIDKLWAEACYLEAKGERIYPPVELLDALAIEQDARQETDEWEPKIRQSLIDIKNVCEAMKKPVKTTFSEATAVLGVDTAYFDREKQLRARRCMKHIGWDYAKNARGKKKMLHGAPLWQPFKTDWELDDDEREAKKKAEAEAKAAFS